MENIKNNIAEKQKKNVLRARILLLSTLELHSTSQKHSTLKVINC